jgi:hypothetical protein
MKWGFKYKKTGGWSSTRPYKQVAKAKLDLSKTQVFLVVAKGIWRGEDDHKGVWVRAPTLGYISNGP